MHHGKRHRRRTRKMRGGASNTLVGNNYEQVPPNGGSSGWSYVNNLVGGLDQQYNGALMGSGSGNQLAINNQTSTMSGGRRRRHRSYSRRHRRRRGGSFGPIISDAVVPLTLLAAQQTYGRKLRKTKSRRTRRG
jgi:hypothetical protein